MPRIRPTFSDFFYSPLTEDVETIIARFQHTDSVRYAAFSAIWREMNFQDVFIGLLNMAEMKRFGRVAMVTAMTYFLPPYSYHVRVGGLYLLFAFYHTQTAIPPVPIRLALKNWDYVQKFLKDSVDAGHLDVIYIYQKLVSAKAFHYVAMPHFLEFLKQRKPKKESMCAEFLGRTTAVQELLLSDIMEELTNIQDKYEKLKKATVEDSTQVNTSHADFSSRLKDSMSQFITWQEKAFSENIKGEDSEEDEDKFGEDEHSDTSSSSTRARLLSSIKQKSYTNYQEVSKSRRHCQPETVDMSILGADNFLGGAVVRRRRPPSLRARTTKSLGVVVEKKIHTWLLSAPEGQQKLPRANQPPPFRE